MTKSFLLVLVCAILSAACQKEKKKAVIPSCGGDTSLNKTAPFRYETFKLSKVIADVTQVDCEGDSKTTKDQVLKDPKDAYRLTAQTLKPGSETYEVSAFNRTTCSNATIKPNRRPEDTHMEIQMHTSPNTRRMHVQKNADNYIDYEFRRCLEKDLTQKCVRSEVAERGTVVLRIDYSERKAEPVIRNADCSKR